MGEYRYEFRSLIRTVVTSGLEQKHPTMQVVSLRPFMPFGRTCWTQALDTNRSRGFVCICVAVCERKIKRCSMGGDCWNMRLCCMTQEGQRIGLTLSWFAQCMSNVAYSTITSPVNKEKLFSFMLPGFRWLTGVRHNLCQMAQWQ